METTATHARASVLYLYLFILILIFAAHLSQAQPKDPVKLLVHVADGSDEDIPFANVVIYNTSGRQITVGTSNMEGVVVFDKLEPAEYKVKGIYIGYLASEVNIDLRGKGRYFPLELLFEEGGSIIIGCFDNVCCSRDGFTEEELESEGSLQTTMEEEEVVDLKQDLNDFRCFPNPAKENLHITIDGVEATEMLMISETGQVLRHFDLTKEWDLDLDMRQQRPGLYYFICYGNGKSSAAKMVVRVE